MMLDVVCFARAHIHVCVFMCVCVWLFICVSKCCVWVFVCVCKCVHTSEQNKPYDKRGNHLQTAGIAWGINDLICIHTDGCPADSYSCDIFGQRGSKCFLKENRCSGATECANGADEHNCSKYCSFLCWFTVIMFCARFLNTPVVGLISKYPTQLQ